MNTLKVDSFYQRLRLLPPPKIVSRRTLLLSVQPGDGRAAGSW